MAPIGAMFGLSAVVGPLVGGFFTDHQALGWQWCFWVNIPVGIAALLVGWFALTLPRKHTTARLDYAGIALLSAATTSLILFTDLGGTLGWTSGTTLGLLAAFLVSVVLLVPVELRAEQPILPMGLFRSRTFLVTIALGAPVGLAMFSVIAFMPTFLQMSSGLSAAGSGMLMLPMVAGIIVTIQGTGRIIARTGRYKVFVVAGVLVIGGTMAWLSTLSGTTTLWVIGAMLFGLGAGLGLIMQNIVLAAQNAVSAHDIGVATSTTSYFREVGATLGVAVFGTLFTGRLAENLRDALDANANQAVAAGITSPDSLVPAAVQAGSRCGPRS